MGKTHTNNTSSQVVQLTNSLYEYLAYNKPWSFHHFVKCKAMKYSKRLEIRDLSAIGRKKNVLASGHVHIFCSNPSIFIDFGYDLY